MAEAGEHAEVRFLGSAVGRDSLEVDDEHLHRQRGILTPLPEFCSVMDLLLFVCSFVYV